MTRSDADRPAPERAGTRIARDPVRGPRRISIRTQLVALVLAIALPASGLVAYGIIDAANEARAAAHGRVGALASLIVSRIDHLIDDHEHLLARLAERPLVRAMDPKVVDPFLREMVLIEPELHNLGVRDRQANTIYSFRPNPTDPGTARGFPWFREGIANARFTAGDAFKGRLSGRMVIVLTHPIRDNRGEVTGLLNVSVDLQRLQERVMEAAPGEALVAVIDRANRYLMRSVDPERWIGEPVPSPQSEQIRDLREGLHELTGPDGVRRIYAIATVPVTGWQVFVGVPVETFLAPHRERMVRSAAFGALVLLLALWLAYRIGSAIARPIGELARAASGSDGIPLASAPATGSAEVEIVASRLSGLAREREQARGERAALMDHYESILKAARDIYLLIDEAGRIVDFNDAAVVAYGYAPEALREMAIADLRAPQARESLERDWRASAGPGGALYETMHRRSDGTTFSVEASTRVLEIDGKRYRQSLVRDISARKTADDLLRRQNEELDRFNRAAVGRELDVIELKHKVNALALELGREPPYPLAFLDDAGPSGAQVPPR